MTIWYLIIQILHMLKEFIFIGIDIYFCRINITLELQLQVDTLDSATNLQFDQRDFFKFPKQTDSFSQSKAYSRMSARVTC